MQIEDYLIDQKHTDWSSALEPWDWLLPERCTLWMVNRFCDCFLIKDDGSVWMLDVGIGTLEAVAKSVQQFVELARDADRFNGWFLSDLVDVLVAAGLTLQPAQSYCFKWLPLLGGKYAVENVYVNSIDEYLAASADVHRQLKDVPDGTPYTVKIRW